MSSIENKCLGQSTGHASKAEKKSGFCSYIILAREKERARKVEVYPFRRFEAASVFFYFNAFWEGRG